MEVYDNPEEALCDGPHMVYLDKLEDLLKDLIAINEIIKKKINDELSIQERHFF